MATIVLHEDAPRDEKITFLIAGETFSTPHDTNDPEIVAAAHAHPWLDVEGEIVEPEAEEEPEAPAEVHQVADHEYTFDLSEDN